MHIEGSFGFKRERDGAFNPVGTTTANLARAAL